MAQEIVGETAKIETADHPVRTDSPTYIASRKWLMDDAAGGCVVCGGQSDLSHPGKVASSSTLQDHHRGGIYVVIGGKPVLVGINPFPMEWSEGWGAAPAVVAQHVAALNLLLTRLGQPQYPDSITDTASVMAYVDSTFNANVKLCAAHHIGLEEKSALDAQGHQAVGVHNIPYPIWAYQIYCDWAHWNMWAGTTGTIAIAPDPSTGGARVLHISRAAHATDPRQYGRKRKTRHRLDLRQTRHLPAPGHNLVQAAKTTSTTACR
jgi:hypothetical protein